jgi:CBS domain-containing protein
MLVRDIMTREVMTVTPETPVPALAALFAERGISACRWSKPAAT